METQLMKYEELQKLVETATAGMKFKLIFVPNVVDDPDYPKIVPLSIWGMMDHRVITADGPVLRFLEAVYHFNKWGSNWKSINGQVGDRVIVVEILPKFDKEWFLERLSPFLQNAELCS